MKRVLILILALTLIGSTFAFFGCEQKDAQTGETDNEQQNQTADAGNGQDEEPVVTPDGADFRYETTEGGVTITAYTGTEKRIAIPSTIDGKAVVGIQSFGITNDDKDINVVEHLEIPDSVVSIASNAFRANKTLVEVNIGNGVTSIKATTFAFCSHLKKVNVGNNVRRIFYGAFEHCYALEDISLPTGLELIDANAFQNCNFSSITLPGTIQCIGTAAFVNNRKLQTVVLEDGLQFVHSSDPTSGTYCFSGCTELKTVTVPASVTMVTDTTFDTSYSDTASNLQSIRFLGNAPTLRTSSSGIVNKEIIVYYPANATGWDTTRLGELYTLTPYQPD